MRGSEFIIGSLVLLLILASAGFTPAQELLRAIVHSLQHIINY